MRCDKCDFRKATIMAHEIPRCNECIVEELLASQDRVKELKQALKYISNWPIENVSETQQLADIQQFAWGAIERTVKIKGKEIG